MINEATKNKAFKYFCMGLNSKEIAKLLDLNFRTVQQICTRENWKAKRTPLGLTARIQQLRKQHLTYVQIAEKLKISKSTVYKHLKTSSNGIQQSK